LGIWNTRVEEIRSRYPHLRTVVLVKSNDLLKLTAFEFDTIRYDAEQFEWKWNKGGNLEGWRSERHFFTWQPHGSQFTIIEQVPDDKVCIKLRQPEAVNEEEILKAIGFDDSWVEVVK